MAIQVIEQSSLPNTNMEGRLYGSAVSVIIEHTARDGAGPRLHSHPYTETFVIHGGRALFRIGDEEIVAVGGQILVAAPEVPHKFTVIGPETYDATHIHANDTFITRWLE